MPVARILGLDAVEPGSLQPFYTSDFIDGVALDTFARASTWQQVETAEADAIEALGLLHQAGVRHGDIKPDNILVHAGRGTLIDLGCARPLGAMPDGTISGTGAFMAPELL
jgi:serine/threonine protein kinase